MRIQTETRSLPTELSPEELAAESQKLATLLHLAAMLAVRPCECEGDCDTCAPCLARAVLGVEERPAAQEATP